MFKRLTLLFTIILLFSITAAAFHHHDDGEDHPECSICFAAHQQADSVHSVPILATLFQAVETPYLRPCTAIVEQTFFPCINNRAPPA